MALIRVVQIPIEGLQQMYMVKRRFIWGAKEGGEGDVGAGDTLTLGWAWGASAKGGALLVCGRESWGEDEGHCWWFVGGVEECDW